MTEKVMSDKEANEILEKQTNHVTKEMIDNIIQSVTYTILPSRKTMICEIILQNGFSVIGTSSCVDPKNFNEDLGKKYSYEQAYDKIWELEAYTLQSKLYEEK